MMKIASIRPGVKRKIERVLDLSLSRIAELVDIDEKLSDEDRLKSEFLGYIPQDHPEWPFWVARNWDKVDREAQYSFGILILEKLHDEVGRRQDECVQRDQTEGGGGMSFVPFQLQEMGGQRAIRILHDIMADLSMVESEEDLTTFELNILHRCAVNPPARTRSLAEENEENARLAREQAEEVSS